VLQLDSSGATSGLAAPPGVDGSMWAQAPEAVRHRVLEKHRFQQQQQQQQQQGMLPETRSTPLPPRMDSNSPMGRPPPAVAMRLDSIHGMSAAVTTPAMAAASGTAAGHAARGATGIGSPAGRAGMAAMLADQPLRRHNSAPITTGEVVVSRQPSAAVQSVTTHGPTL
jgi:hypothetical protein